MICRTYQAAARATLALGLLTIVAAPTAFAQKLDRDKAPTVGKSLPLRVPTWTKTRLANGADLIVVEKRDLPLIAVNIDFVGGASNYEPADKLGVAQFAGQMLSEGTRTKTADQLSDAQQLLGTAIQAGVGSESGTISFTSAALTLLNLS